jgi:hypothetical protein
MRKSKKAIYFNGEYNQFNTGVGLQCITYDSTNGFQFIDDNKTVSLEELINKDQNILITELSGNISGNLNKIEQHITEFDDLSKKVVSEMDNLSGHITKYDELASNVTNHLTEFNTLQTDVNTISGTLINDLIKKIQSLEKTITVMIDKNNGKVETDTTIIVTAVSGNIISKNFEKDIIVYPTTTEKPVTLQGKSITVDGFTTTANDTKKASLTIKSTKDVSIENLKVDGSFEMNTNQIDIQTGETIKITQTNIDASGYNGVMIGQGDRTVLPKSVIIENVDFNMAEGKLTNNTVNIFATAENAEIIIRNCNFGEASNPIRFGNSTNASGVNVIIENCHFVKWEEKRPWCGVILFEDFEDWTLVQKEFPPTDDEGKSTKNKDYRERVLPELIKVEDQQNRFGKDKIKITFKNCTYGANKTSLVFDVNDYASRFGTNDTNQIAMVCRYSGYSSINAAYDEKIKAENDGKYPDGRTWYACMLPYSNDVDYLEAIAAPSGITLTKLNSDCYPTIIFE